VESASLRVAGGDFSTETCLLHCFFQVDHCFTQDNTRPRFENILDEKTGSLTCAGAYLSSNLQMNLPFVALGLNELLETASLRVASGDFSTETCSLHCFFQVDHRFTQDNTRPRFVKILDGKTGSLTCAGAYLPGQVEELPFLREHLGVRGESDCCHDGAVRRVPQKAITR
jgi:hypothetical protein